jgi:peptide-methionine (R)-S-oxide reductase
MLDDRPPLQPVLSNGIEASTEPSLSGLKGSLKSDATDRDHVALASNPVAPSNPDERPLPAGGPACDASGCGCGDDEPIPLTPVEWIAQLEDEAQVECECAWLEKLAEAQFRVLRMKGTEDVDSGEYNEHFEVGTYHCAGCARPLYESTHKFRSGHGWPAFFDALPDALERHTVKRKVEITCAGCGGHIGHVFKSSRYPKPTNERHCVNSVSLNFIRRDE